MVAKVGIPPILATLGTMQLYTGIATVITKGYAVLGYPEPFLFIGNGVIGIFPVPLVLFVLVVVIFALVLNKTAFGFQIFMLGTNVTAAHFSGINKYSSAFENLLAIWVFGWVSRYNRYSS